MKIRYYKGTETGTPHIYKHGVTEREVEEVLDSPGEDRSGSEGSRVALGRTRSGRCLRVIYVPEEDADAIFVITAYDLKGKPLLAYRRRRRRRKKCI